MSPSQLSANLGSRARLTVDTLDLIARLRYVTIPLLVVHLGLSPDSAYRLLRRLTNAGLLRSFPWRSGARVGPPSSVSILTPKGARLLVDADLHDRLPMTRLLKSTSARAHDVQAGLVTTLGHDLDVLQFHALLTLSARQRGDITLWWPTWNEAYKAPLCVDFTLLSVAERVRLFGERQPSVPSSIAYVPDATIILDGADGTRSVVFFELETGKGGRSAQAIGAVKAAKMHAVFQHLASGHELPLLGRPRLQDIRFAVWCPTNGFRDGILAGARRVLSGETLPFLATSATFVPLLLPAGLQKGQVVSWLEAKAAPLLTSAWTDVSGTTTQLLSPPAVASPSERQIVPEPAQLDVFDPSGAEPFFQL